MKNRRNILIAGGVALILIVLVGYSVGGFGSSDRPSVPRPTAGNDYDSNDGLSGPGTVVERDARSDGASGQSAGRLAGSEIGDEGIASAGDEPVQDKKKRRKKKRSRRTGDADEEEEEEKSGPKSAGPKFGISKKLP